MKEDGLVGEHRNVGTVARSATEGMLTNRLQAVSRSRITSMPSVVHICCKPCKSLASQANNMKDLELAATEKLN